MKGYFSMRFAVRFAMRYAVNCVVLMGVALMSGPLAAQTEKYNMTRGVTDISHRFMVCT